MKYLLIIFFVGLSGCGINNGTNDYNQYLFKFNQDAISLGYKPIDFSQTNIVVTDLYRQRQALGFCNSIEVKNNGPAVLTFDLHVIKNSNFDKLFRVYHEIGHCFLGLYHIEGHHIMNPTTETLSESDAENESKRLALVKEMFDTSAYTWH